jgi:hypothetical protein
MNKKEETAAATEALDGALARIGELVKSNEEIDVSELAQDENFTAQFLAELQKAGKSAFPGAMAPYGKGGKRKNDDDDDDDKDEKGKAEKSLNFDTKTAEYVDAVPILKAFAEAIEAQAVAINVIGDKVGSLTKSVADQTELVKAIAEVEQGSAILVKSLAENMQAVGSQPLPVKGLVPASVSDLSKSFGGDGSGSQKVDTRKLEGILLKSVQEGKLDVGIVTKYEATRNLAMLPKAIVAEALVGSDEE